MSQPRGHQGEHSTVDYRPSARPREPQIVDKPIPLKDRITLYYGTLRTDSAPVQKLILLKTRRVRLESGLMGGLTSCGYQEQQRITFAAEKNSQNEDHPWDWTASNIGRYIASGLTQPKDLELVLGLTEEEIEEIPNGEIHFPPDHLARTRQNDVYRGANERLLANRVYFKERVDVEDRNRHAEQANLAPPNPATQISPVGHAYLAGQASSTILASREKRN